MQHKAVRTGLVSHGGRRQVLLLSLARCGQRCEGADVRVVSVGRVERGDCGVVPAKGAQIYSG